MMRFRDAVFLLVLVAGLATASAAWSAGPPVVDQYYEQVPDASGGAGTWRRHRVGKRRWRCPGAVSLGSE